MSVNPLVGFGVGDGDEVGGVVVGVGEDVDMDSAVAAVRSGVEEGVVSGYSDLCSVNLYGADAGYGVVGGVVGGEQGKVDDVTAVASRMGSVVEMVGARSSKGGVAPEECGLADGGVYSEVV